MKRSRFDRLHTVRLAHESPNGCAQLCREPDGTLTVRLRVRSDACQRELLSGLDEAIPARLEGGFLELLLPWHDGVPLRQWLREQRPALGQRRDACLSLLGQLVQARGSLPPCLTALSAISENLSVAGGSMSLQYLPELSRWEPGMDEARAVGAVAELVCEVLYAGAEPRRGGSVPEELSLLALRLEEGGYTGWGRLQRDVAAVPDAPPPRGSPLRACIRRICGWLRRHERCILRTLAALLLAAALLSLASACLRRGREQEAPWPGMSRLGGQDLQNGEGGG